MSDAVAWKSAAVTVADMSGKQFKSSRRGACQLPGSEIFTTQKIDPAFTQNIG